LNTASRSGFEPTWVHFVIFSLGALLIGLNGSVALPDGVAHTTLQSGIIAVIAALGFGYSAARIHSRSENAKEITRVEKRLDEHSGQSERAIGEIAASNTEAVTSSQSNPEFSRRTAFVGVLAWVSVCLFAAGLFPELALRFNGLWTTSGLVGLLSTVGLLEVIKRDRRTHDYVLSDSRTDALTGLANRREADRRLAELISSSRRKNVPLCVLMIDIDFFKRLNDAHGHQMGDDVLKSTGRTLENCVRNVDVVARYGGEEFVVLLPEVNLETGRWIADRIRSAVQAQHLSYPGPSEAVTISSGLVPMDADDDSRSLLFRADKALYRAKESGRNRTFCWADGTYLPVVSCDTPQSQNVELATHTCSHA
jgi:diguanylate cyclase (GGDEF)-like protein